MSREEGLSNDEIAKRLDISKRTVENHLTAALAILRKVLYLFFSFAHLNRIVKYDLDIVENKLHLNQISQTE